MSAWTAHESSSAVEETGGENNEAPIADLPLYKSFKIVIPGVLLTGRSVHARRRL